MTPATSQAMAATQAGMTNGPIFSLSDTNRTSGTIAKGSCIDSTTWLNTSSRAVPDSP